MAIYQDLGFSTFQIQIFLSFLVSHQKKFCFSKQIYFCLTKKILRLIASIEKKIYYKRQIQSLQEVGDFVKSRKIARPFLHYCFRVENDRELTRIKNDWNHIKSEIQKQAIKNQSNSVSTNNNTIQKQSIMIF